jgi:hypothetical protein
VLLTGSTFSYPLYNLFLRLLQLKEVVSHLIRTLSIETKLIFLPDVFTLT